jgi:hypothetical protein
MARVRHSDMGYHCNDGVPSLAKRTIDGSDYGVLILASIFFWTDLFVAGSGCHMQGAIAFADWILQKVKVRQCLSLRETNVLVHNPSVALEDRSPSLFMLLLPVIVGVLSESQRRNGGAIYESNCSRISSTTNRAPVLVK